MSRKKHYGIFFLVLFLSMTVQTVRGQSTSPNADNADSLRNLASAQGRAGRFLEAADTLKAYLQRRPDDFAARLEMGRLLSWSGRYRVSAETYQQVLQAQPENIKARLGLARVLSWGRHYDEAIQHYRKVLEQDPENREAGVEQALVHAWKGNLNRALELYSDLQKLYPNDREVLLGKGGGPCNGRGTSRRPVKFWGLYAANILVTRKSCWPWRGLNWPWAAKTSLCKT